MEQIWVRKAEAKDSNLLAQWLQSTANNLFDPAVFFYPQTSVLVAHKKEPILFLPIQLAAVLESLAIKPGAGEREVASALAQLIKAAVLMSRDKGLKELYFMCADESTAEFAKRHYFEEMPHRTFRLKLDSLEGSNVPSQS